MPSSPKAPWRNPAPDLIRVFRAVRVFGAPPVARQTPACTKHSDPGGQRRAPAASSCARSSSVRPRWSRSTVAVSAPRQGELAAVRWGRRDRRTGLPTWRSGPTSGCSSVTMNPRSVEVGVGVVVDRTHHRHRRDAGLPAAARRRPRPVGRGRPRGQPGVDVVARGRAGPSSVSSVGSAGQPTAAASRRQASSSRATTASHRSSPAAGYTPWGTAVSLRLPTRLGVGAVGGGLQVDLADQVGGGLGLRHVDELALARALAVVEGGEHRDGHQLAGDVVGVVQRRPARIRRVGVVPEQVDAGEPGVERPVRGHLAERPAAPVPLRRRVDHVGVHAGARRRSPRPSLSSTPPRRFSATMSAPAHSSSASRRPCVGRQVERDALAAAVLGVEGEGLVELATDAAGEAQHVGVGQRLDADRRRRRARTAPRSSRARRQRRRTRSRARRPAAARRRVAWASPPAGAARSRHHRHPPAVRGGAPPPGSPRAGPGRSRTGAPRSPGWSVVKNRRLAVCGWATNSDGRCSTPTVVPSFSDSSNSCLAGAVDEHLAGDDADDVGVHQPDRRPRATRAA